MVIILSHYYRVLIHLLIYSTHLFINSTYPFIDTWILIYDIDIPSNDIDDTEHNTIIIISVVSPTIVIIIMAVIIPLVLICKWKIRRSSKVNISSVLLTISLLKICQRLEKIILIVSRCVLYNVYLLLLL